MSTIEIRTDAVNCDLEISGAMPEIYADGHSHMMCVNNNIKLVLHSVTDAPLGECFQEYTRVTNMLETININN